MSDKLKPCPFCGGEAHIVTAVGESWVLCDKCKATTEAHTSRQFAIDAWNRRASDRTTTRNGRYRTKYGRKVPLCECCGYSIGDLRWKFCPSCGAEVVDHD